VIELEERIRELEERIQPFPLLKDLINPLFFPRDRQWYWEPAVKKSRTLKPGESIEIMNKRGSGWLYSAILWTDSPYATLKVELYTRSVLTFDLPIESVYQLGFYGLGLGQFTVTRYDDTNNVYVMSYVPISYGAPFRDRIKVEVYNPLPAGNITLNFAEAVLVMLE